MLEGEVAQGHRGDIFVQLRRWGLVNRVLANSRVGYQAEDEDEPIQSFKDAIEFSRYRK